MRLTELKLRDFRTYEELVFRPGQGLNLLVGDNAQGKSNLLEAIHLLAITRSLRAGKETEMIRHKAPFAVISAEITKEKENDARLDVTLFQMEKKLLRINGSRHNRVLDLLGILNVIFFGALDLGIVSAEPSIRRRYLNLEISQISPKYVYDLADCKKSLEQRNRLLRDLRERPVRDSGLEAWNEQLIKNGVPIIHKRKFFIDSLAPLVEEIHRELTGGRETLILKYLPSVPIEAGADIETISQSFRAGIARLAQDELRRGATLIGPQRDDIQFFINGMDARTYGSQGQQRTVILSLKLAEFRLMEEYVGESPVMLLDDVMSDLDDERRSQLLQWIRGRCQTFLTSTNIRAIPPDILSTAAIYRVENGIITLEKGSGD